MWITCASFSLFTIFHQISHPLSINNLTITTSLHRHPGFSIHPSIIDNHDITPNRRGVTYTLRTQIPTLPQTRRLANPGSQNLEFITHSESYHSLARPHFFLRVAVASASSRLSSLSSLCFLHPSTSKLKIALLTLLKRRNLHVAININIHLHVHMYT